MKSRKNHRTAINSYEFVDTLSAAVGGLEQSKPDGNSGIVPLRISENVIQYGLSEAELRSRARREQLVQTLESGKWSEPGFPQGAKRFKVYSGKWRESKGVLRALRERRIVRDEKHHEPLSTHSSPKNLLVWLTERNSQQWEWPLVIEEELPKLIGSPRILLTAVAPTESQERMARGVERGEFCDQVITEMRRIRNLVMETGRSMAEVERDHPAFVAWKVRAELGAEDQEQFNHPRQWETVVGYAKTILSKIHGKSPHTINSWLKAYRKDLRAKRS